MPTSTASSGKAPKAAANHKKKAGAAKRKAAAPTTKAAAAPVPDPAVAAAPATTEPKDPQAQKRLDEFKETYDTLTEALASITAQTVAVKKQMAKLQKLFTKEQALLERATKKKARNKTLSGFAKPGYISKELCAFLNKPEHTELARTDVTKYLTKYIEDHKLQDNENRRVIKPNKALARLLAASDDDQITYFNLQSYMKRHYIQSNQGSGSSSGAGGRRASSSA